MATTSKNVSAGAVIGLSITIMIFANIGIQAINSTVNANTFGWSATNIALYGLIILAVILGFVYVFLPNEWRK